MSTAPPSDNPQRIRWKALPLLLIVLSSAGEVTQSSQTKQEKENKLSPTPRKDGESITDYAKRVAEEHQAHRTRKEEEAKVDTNPTEAEKPTEENAAPANTQTEKTNNSRGDSQSKEQPTEVPTGVRSCNENGTLPQSTPTEVESETDYTLSDKKAENGENFYQDANGNIDLANIPEEVFDKIGKPKAPLRLTPSMLKHVFDRHGKEMGLSRTDDAIDFILDVMDNFGHVRQGDKNAVIFSIENGRSRTGRRAVTILLNSESGEYYGIKTSGHKRIEGLNKKPLLWEKGANETSATGAAPANVTTEQAQQGSEPAGSASNHSNGSIGKVTQSSQTKETKEDKLSPTPRKDGESITDYAERVAEEHQAQRTRKEEEAKVDTNPTEAQKPTEENAAPANTQTEETNNSRGDSQSKEHPTEVPTGVRSSNENGTLPQSAPTKVDKEPQPIGNSFFGKVYNQFKGKAKEAVNFLMRHKSGKLLGVFHRNDIGEISLVWGDEKGGLAHIISKHIVEQNDFNNIDEVINTMQQVINNGTITRENKDKVVIDYNDYRVAIRKQTRDNNGNVVEQGNWIVTAFDKSRSKKDKTPSEKTLSTPPFNQETDGVTLPSNGVPADKVTQSSQTKETKEDKFSPTPRKDGESITDYAERVAEEHQAQRTRKEEEAKVDTNPKEAARQQTTATLTNDTEAKQKATEAVLAALSKAGIEVVRATDEEVKALLSNSHATTLRTPQGTIYGWSVNGKIYLTEAGINPDTPIHEYTHLWAEAMMIKNKQGWNSIKSLLKDTPVWKEVIADPNYSSIKDNEDAVASEVLSRISGKKNAAKMEEEAQRAIDEAKGVFEKARATTILTNLKKALNSLWKWVSKNIFDVKEFSSINEVTDKVLYDLIHGTKLINDKSLIGVHNISEQKLRKVLKQGGFANPSIAVIDTDKQVHNDYGEISLILPSRKVNKSTGKNVGTYEGDAWTPMYPIIEKQMSSDGSLIMHNDINSVPNEMQSEVRNALNRWLDNGSDTDLSYLYLFQQGKAPKMATVKPKYSNEVYKSLRDIMFGVDSVYNLTKGEVKKLVELYVQTELNGDIDEYNKANERRIAKYKETIESGRTNSMYYKIAERNLEEVKKYGYPLSSLKTFADDVQRDKTKQGSKNVQKTLNAASQIIKDTGLEEDFRNWVEGLNNRYQTKEVIFDGFTPTGKRRYIPNTLENVSKLMKKQGRQASTGLGVSFSNFAASVMKANGSLANIRKKKSKLTNEHKDIENFEEKWKEVYFDLAMKLQPNASTFDDYGFTRLQEAALEAEPQAFLSKEYGVTLSKEDVRKLQQMVKAIQEERPAMYFETKFERPVTLNEFSKAVIPEDLSDDLQKTLRDNGIEIFTYKRGDAEDRQKATQEAAYSSDDIAFQIISNGNNEANNDSNPRFQIVGNSLSDEEKKIVETAKANDTYMKAPNGKPTNLSEKQWAQVRTKAFKKWFGDWEKAARIEKLRRSKAVKITEADYEDKYDLTRNSAKQWAKDNIRGEYMIADTGEKVNVSKVSINEVLSHGERDAAHLKSISSIGKLLHNAIFITETPNAKDNDKYESYRYYIEGVKIDGEDYTAKIVVGVKNGKTYYDHRLTKIEKGSLLDSLNGLSNSVAEKQQTSFTGKDSKLLSILQTNSSKVVDENGEPMVVYHGTLADGLRQFSTDFIGSRYSYDEKGFFFISNRKIADDYAVSEFDASRRGEVIDAYVSLGNPLVVNSEWCRKNGLGSNVFKDNDVIEFWDNYQSLIVEESEQNDGVIVTDGETSMVVAFFPNQIKSATGNNGNFSTTEDDILYRTVFGGNSGYVGYSMSKRAAEAKEEGRYPKTEFRREYHITAKSLDMLTSLGIINNSEWHHTSMYGNKTPFYGWTEDEFADDYLKHKKEIDTLCKGIDPKTK